MLLRDRTGIVQLVSSDSSEVLSELKTVPLESSLCIEGEVIERPEGQISKSLDTGDVEVKIESVRHLNKSVPNLPFLIKPYNEANEPLRLKHRYLDLRNKLLQDNLKTRSEMMYKMRNFLCDNGFMEVETPTLFRRTPGGAREFVVPTHMSDHFYSLVSPITYYN